MLLLAAGRGTRYGGAVPKAFLPLRGRPLLLHAAERLAAALPPAAGGELLVVAHRDDSERHLEPLLPGLRAAVGARIGVRTVEGGATRQQSVRLGLAATSPDVELVLVHDAARPLVPIAAVADCVAAAARTGAALLALPATDTPKRVRDQRVEATLERASIWLAQTPQVIRRDLLLRAMAAAEADGFDGTDDVSLVERLGLPVEVVPGARHNLKITHPDDLPLAEALFEVAR